MSKGGSVPWGVWVTKEERVLRAVTTSNRPNRELRGRLWGWLPLAVSEAPGCLRSWVCVPHIRKSGSLMKAVVMPFLSREPSTV